MLCSYAAFYHATCVPAAPNLITMPIVSEVPISNQTAVERLAVTAASLAKQAAARLPAAGVPVAAVGA